MNNQTHKEEKLMEDCCEKCEHFEYCTPKTCPCHSPHQSSAEEKCSCLKDLQDPECLLHSPQKDVAEKEKIYAILDKVYKDKDYIDCAYEDFKVLFTTQRTSIMEETKNHILDWMSKKDFIDRKEYADFISKLKEI